VKGREDTIHAGGTNESVPLQGTGVYLHGEHWGEWADRKVYTSSKSRGVSLKIRKQPARLEKHRLSSHFGSTPQKHPDGCRGQQTSGGEKKKPWKKIEVILNLLYEHVERVP